jgi:hypothetical protein
MIATAVIASAIAIAALTAGGYSARASRAPTEAPSAGD